MICSCILELFQAIMHSHCTEIVHTLQLINSEYSMLGAYRTHTAGEGARNMCITVYTD